MADLAVSAATQAQAAVQTRIAEAAMKRQAQQDKQVADMIAENARQARQAERARRSGSRVDLFA